MLSIQFWKSWPKQYQFLFWILSACLTVALVAFLQGWLNSPAPVITYDHYQQVQSIEVPTHSFSVGLINITVPAESYLIFENVFGSALQPNAFALYFLLVAMLIAFVFFISIITALNRFRFLMGMGIVILFLASLQIDALEIFGLTGKVMTISLILFYGILSFYFHSIKPQTTFTQRLFLFLLLTLLAGFTAVYFAKTTTPLLQLAANSLFPGIIVCLIFILMVSHEIVASFVTIITQSVKSQKSLQHFLILTSVYIINLFLMFASKMGIIEWSFFSVNAFVLIVVSSVLGIWGFRQRGVVYEDILHEEPLRLYLFMSLALASFGAMMYFASSASDMMMDTLEDLIIAAHLGGGLIFALYVIANFSPMLAKNLPVHRVLYKPETMPLFTFRLMAVIATFAILSWAVSWKTYLNQMVATYYHAHGDLYLSQGDDVNAEKQYLRSLQFRNQNMHAHYALASIYASRSESIKERKEYDKAVEWTPSVPLYLNLARSYSFRGDVLEAALTLSEAGKKFPKSGELQIAAGLSFLKLKNSDSALYYFLKAKNTNSAKLIAETNLIGTCASFNLNYPVDSIISLSDAGNAGVIANELAFANLKRQQIVAEGKITDTALNVYEAMTLSNYLINQKENTDTSLIRNVVQLSRKLVNDSFAEQLLISSTYALYAHEQVKEAMQLLRDIAFASNEPKYFSLMGLWLLEQNNPVLAKVYFKAAAEKSHPLALYYQAIAETEADSLSLALVSWDSLSKTTDKGVVAFADKMKKVLKAKPDQVSKLTDDEKYFFCRYKISLTDKILFNKVLNEITDEQLRSRAIVDRSKKWFAMDEIKEAVDQLNQLHAVSGKDLKRQVSGLKLMYAADMQDWKYIQQNLSSSEISFNQKIYFEALLAIQTGNQKSADQKFNYLLNANNQFEEGIVAATRYFSNDTTNRLKNFSSLVDGLLAKPNSVKILKQHVLIAASMGFEQVAQDSLDKLKILLTDEAFRKFIAANPDFFMAK